MKRKIIIPTAVIATAIVSFAFTPDDCKQKNWGTKTLYTPQDTLAVKAPAGYEPAFINYVGRHGARHTTGLEEAFMLKRILQQAASENGLTNEGKELQQKVLNVIAVESKYQLGTLTKNGEEELYNIGKRLKAHYPQVFNDNIKVVSTKQKRTKESAASFEKGAGIDTIAANVKNYENDSIALRFYEIAPGYRSFVKGKSWSPSVNKLADGDVGTRMSNEIVNKFFKKGFAAKIIGKELADTLDIAKVVIIGAPEITDGIYSVASITNAIAHEAVANGMTVKDIDIASLLTCSEFNWLEYINSAKDYLLKGPGQDINGIQVRNAAPLLVDFINTTDSFIQYGKTSAVLRFAHAETMSPIAALMQIDGAANRSANIADYDKSWQAKNIIPFSANMQWILYKPASGHGDYLLTILYNEKPVKIPVSTNNFPFYKWKDVKKFYTDKLQAMHVSVSDDMYSYLQKL